MAKTFEKKGKCCGCGACAAVCKTNAIRMAVDGEGFLYPKINASACIKCGRCKAVCPMGRPRKEKEEGIYLGAQAKEDSIRFVSSSGGAFAVLAKYILGKDGVVFGAAMEEDGMVRHRDIQNLEELSLLQKTKYVQSDMEDCFERVKRYLKAGRLVLFTGTPCQCQAMKLYIGDHENLFLADLVCYGVPSPKIWKKYVKELEKKYKGKFSSFYFRDKQERSNGHTIAVKIGNHVHRYPMRQDPFCRIYFRNYTIRPSCYFCNFCTTNRESDWTLGDFWGIEKVKPEMDDGMGTSLVILHNAKAVQIWEAVKKDFRYVQCQEEDVLQPRLCTPVSRSTRRWKFMLLNKFLPLYISERILRR